jgi:hypothetical protein
MARLFRWRVLPGAIAAGLSILVTCAWTFWGVAELFHEGWYGPVLPRLLYLAPAGLCLAFTLVALAWPRLGGGILIAGGAGAMAWWCWMAARRGVLTLGGALSMSPVLGGLALVGALFLVEARHRRRRQAAGWAPPANWLRRNLLFLLAIGLPLLLGLGLSVEPALRVAGRLDDGYRGTRRIQGSGVDLLWAPAGPGWVTTSAGPSWNELALYGVPPVGLAGKEYGLERRCRPGSPEGCATTADVQEYNLCLYLDQAGTTLLAEPQRIWRLPTVEELVRSLVRHGESAGCLWSGRLGQADCRVLPDKETPFWDPTAPVVYYWAADERDPDSAYYVVYYGGVWVDDKSSQMGSRGYRCVRQP